ncbi:fimbrial chaperone [Edwardsiella tarda]|uniref:fimbrial chaperone n=1 Tax=Edwardsiella tarda TaxID=636 RepID=UPI002852861E|nr:fimbrial chaperone [Edwardsiella tarda]UCQ27282.1 fimbrial chaperone [Edwardsiella tarda]
MNKFSKAMLVAALSFAVMGQSMAAFTLSGTRIIFDGGKKNTSFEVTNNSDKTYGGQVWIDNTNQGDGVYMVPAPPFFKIGAKQRQVIRIMNTDTSLPADRESLFWLNVQEVPPKPEAKDGGGSLLAIAMNTRVKLIYRPKALIAGRQDAEKKLTLVQRGNDTWLKNPTPYYMAIVGIKHNGATVKLSDKVMPDITALAPFSEASLGKKVGNSISVEAINDWGGVQTYEVH